MQERMLARMACTVLAFVSVCMSLGGTVAAAETLFSDDFEASHLPQWVGKEGEPHHGVVVDDPLRPGNHVLTFTALNFAGDIFSPPLSVVRGRKYSLRFEYLGRFDPASGAQAGNLGGFIGFTDGRPGPIQRWLAGTALIGGAEDDPLSDDAQWHTYTIVFDPFATFHPAGDAIRLILEDFLESRGVAGDIFFDNVQLATVPDVSGCVNRTGAPVANQAVLLLQRDEPGQLTTTDTDGCYAFERIVLEKQFRVIIAAVRSTGQDRWPLPAEAKGTSVTQGRGGGSAPRH